MSRAALAAAFLLSATGLAAPAMVRADEAYLDDRSTPEALVRSLYNAIDRKEYARAWDYFSTPPAARFEDFAKGYADTESVVVHIGKSTTEGAAGSMYNQVPVAIEARGTDGSTKVFAGCYTLRLADPHIQTPPFKPLHIEKGVLRPAKGSAEEALPTSCGEPSAPQKGEATSPEQEGKRSVLDQARALFAAEHGADCDSLAGGNDPLAVSPQPYEIAFPIGPEKEDEPKQKARLFRFPCNSAAYNATHVYYLATDDDVPPRAVEFAMPDLDLRYENEDTKETLEAADVVGFRTVSELANSDFHPDTNTITSAEKWRGVGDASAAGTWLFRDGAFSLVKFDVDASYDGQQNPETVIDYTVAP